MKTDLVIVGAGPVGILLSILLGKQGKDVVLIERWPEIYDRPRAVTMDHEVARILATLGINVDDDPHFENHKELYYWKNADLEDLQIVDWKSLAPSGWHVTYWFNQPELEGRLLEIARALPSVTVMRGWSATALTQFPDHVEVSIQDTETQTEQKTISAKFLVGADGANSFVRDTLELGVIDKGYFFDWLILDVIPNKDYVCSPAQWQLCDPKRPTTIVPGGPGRRRWEFMVLPGEDNEEIATTESAWKLLAPWGIQPENTKLERSAVYQFQARWAENWQKDRVMIAGDAAHLMPPFAGEGMCAGLRDAVALGWRLNGILDGALPETVLQSYETERAAHAKHYIAFSQELGEIICIADPEIAQQRDAKMMADLAARNHEPITGDKVKLGSGVWCNECPSAGELSPQGVVQYNGIEDRFDQTVGEGWFIISVNTPMTDILSNRHHATLSKLGGRALSIGPKDMGLDVVSLDDSYTHWMASDDANYAIIRPDFYVAATAKTSAELAQRFDFILDRLGIAD